MGQLWADVGCVYLPSSAWRGRLLPRHGGEQSLRKRPLCLGILLKSLLGERDGRASGRYHSPGKCPWLSPRTAAHSRVLALSRWPSQGQTLRIPFCYETHGARATDLKNTSVPAKRGPSCRAVRPPSRPALRQVPISVTPCLLELVWNCLWCYHAKHKSDT